MASEGHKLTSTQRAQIAAGHLVVTPGGPRRAELLQVVESGTTLDHSDGVLKMVSPSGEVTHPTPQETLQALGSGWITYADWVNPSPSPISSFSTTWEVPPPPTSDNGQLLYLFNGLCDANNQHILQPVLQWGTSPDGGDRSWAVASWYVSASGPATQTPLVAVAPGEELVGRMTLSAVNGQVASYQCEFVGLAGTTLNVANVPILISASETLECYGIEACSDYPATSSTLMRSIWLATENGSVGFPFSPVVAVSDCGQHAVLDEGKDDVALWYRSS